MSLVYGILYLTLTMYPYAFHTVRGMSSTKASLPFLSLFAGIVLACLFLGLYSLCDIGRRQTAGKVLRPEHRLAPANLGSVMLPAGESEHFPLVRNVLTKRITRSILIRVDIQSQNAWILQATSRVLTGCGIILVFMSSISFLVDVYLYHANSALAINTFVRSIIAESCPVFSQRMFSTLGRRMDGYPACVYLCGTGSVPSRDDGSRFSDQGLVEVCEIEFDRCRRYIRLSIERQLLTRLPIFVNLNVFIGHSSALSTR